MDHVLEHQDVQRLIASQSDGFPWIEIGNEALELLYQGKAKSAYLTDEPDILVLQFRDDTSAFDGEIIEQLSHKGAINNQFSAFIMARLSEAGIPTHFLTD